jgi:hypothetical protein
MLKEKCFQKKTGLSVCLVLKEVHGSDMGIFNTFTA